MWPSWTPRTSRALALRAGVTVRGYLSGLVFGATNIDVQVVADLVSLDHETFVGVIAVVLLGISVVRVVTAATLGLYDGTDLTATGLGIA